MNKYAFALIVSLFAGNTALADASPKSGDIFLISRDTHGVFAGSHKLFQEDSYALTQVTYCSKKYYVRRQTVAWTQLEAERGNVVRIEYNFGRGWRPICANPETQVSLKDLGISENAEEVVASTDDNELTPQNFLSAISSVFTGVETKNSDDSYHAK
ncbi:hypothetical protein LP7551_02012 [Roseibium album]|nr:hypothetical protein LP7551_02012 [Roseibium album]